MRRTRLNLSALRRGCIVGAGAAAGGRTFSRRQMLGLTGGAVVGTSPALKALEAPFHGPFELIGDRTRVAFKLGGRERWVIDTRRFAGSPSLTVERSERFIRVELKGARYPGTTLSADLRCELRQGATGWRMRLHMALGGFVAEVPLERWLAGREVARSRVHLKGKDLPLGKGSHLKLQGPARAEFSPSWELRLSGSGLAQLSGLGEPILSDSVILSLLAPDAPSILRSPVARRSMIRLERGQRNWTFEVGRRSGRGWKLVTEGSPFDLIEIELGVTRLGLPRRALLATAGLQTEEPRIFFQPDGSQQGAARYTGPGGKPFSLPLQNARYAVSFDAAGDETALLARYGHSVWLRAEGCTLQLGDHSEIEPFELRGERLHCAPALLSVAAPLAGAVVEPTAAPDGARLAFVSDKPVRTHPRSFSRLHLEGAGAGISRLNVTAFSASVLRPEDLLYLRFTSQNLNLQSGAGQQPKIALADTSKPGYLIVTFQPQNIAEQDFREKLDSIPNPPVANSMSGPSRLVFTIPAGSAPIPYTLESLLDWNTWDLSVSPLALQSGYRPARTLDGTYPRPQAPADNQTAIEAPFRLILSPPDLLQGAKLPADRRHSGWAHATGAVSHVNKVTNTSSTELWHTRYAIRRPDGTIDDGANPGLLTLRAIWTPDITAPYDPWSPSTTGSKVYQEDLTANDRRQLVELTSDWNEHSSDAERDLGPYVPKPVTAERLMLSALGAWLTSSGSWVNPPKDADIVEWNHRATMGRDHYVKVVKRGFLFPFGHRAAYVTISERKFEQRAQGFVAYLEQRSFIVVLQQDKTYSPADYPSGWDLPGQHERKMPFKLVRIMTRVTPDINPREIVVIAPPGTEQPFWPLVGSTPFRFHVVAQDMNGQTVEFTAPMIFILDINGMANNEGGVLAPVRGHYNGDYTDTPSGLDGQKVALVHQVPSDVTPDPNLETVSIAFDADIPPAGVTLAAGQPRFYPVMKRASVFIPAMKHLVGQGDGTSIRYNDTYAAYGLDTGQNPGQVYADLETPLSMLFRVSNGEAPVTPALITPNLMITGISAAVGPIGGDTDEFAKGTLEWKKFFKNTGGKDAPQVLGGVALGDVLKPPAPGQSANASPVLKQTVPDHLNPPIQDTRDTSLKLTSPLVSAGIFVGNTDDGGVTITGQAEITASIKQPTSFSGSTADDPASATFELTAKLTSFRLDLVVIEIAFKSFSFTMEQGKKLKPEVELGSVKLKGPLAFVNTLQKYLPNLGGNDLVKPFIDVSAAPPGVTTGVHFHLPDTPVGVFSLSNIKLTEQVTIPFTGDPVRLRFSFADRDDPFTLLVAMFGGRGFLGMDTGPDGVESIEGQLEFGGGFSLSIAGIAHGEAYLMAGIYFHWEHDKDDCSLTGYVRMSASLSVLGLITVSAELYLGLSYDITRNVLYGQATFTAEISIGFFSKSVRGTVERQFAGSGSVGTEETFARLNGSSPVPPSISGVLTQDEWTTYCNAFA